MLRRGIAIASICLAFACGGGAPNSEAHEGRCATDEDCPEGQRCAQLATVCTDPPYCGFCVDAPQ